MCLPSKDGESERERESEKEGRLEEAGQRIDQDTQQRSESKAYGAVGSGTDLRLRLRNVAADGAQEVGHGALIDLGVVLLFENHGRYTGQRLLELVGGIALLLQQLAAFGGVGTGLDVLPGVDVVLASTARPRVHVVREVFARFHHAADEVQRQGLASEVGLIGVGLNVLDGAGVHFVAVALVGSMMAGEFHFRARSRILRFSKWYPCNVNVILQFAFDSRIDLFAYEFGAVRTQGLIVDGDWNLNGAGSCNEEQETAKYFLTHVHVVALMLLLKYSVQNN